MTAISLAHVRAALDLQPFDVVAAQRRMAPRPRVLRRSDRLSGEPRQASVLVLLFPSNNRAGLSLVLTRRTENPADVHSGQIGLPGGARENGETCVQTALRETAEELGVLNRIEILGTLSALYIPPSDFDVCPVVGAIPMRPVWKPDAAEVVEAIECSVSWLLDDAHKRDEEWDFGAYSLGVPWYDVRGHKVWGATAIILSEFEQRLRHVLG